MKKFLGIVASTAIALTLTTAVNAETNTSYIESNSATLTKVYETETSGTTSPAETFSFSITPVSVTDSTYTSASDMPVVEFTNNQTTTTLTYIEGEAGSQNMAKTMTVSFTAIDKPGVYTYSITENIPATKTAGVDYQTSPVYLIVMADYANTTGTDLKYNYVLSRNAAGSEKFEDGTDTDNGKEPSFTNTYKAGTLEIKKQVAGSMASRTKEFAIEVTITKESGTTWVPNLTNSNIKEVVNNNDGTVTIKMELSHNGDSAKIMNIPYNATYTVVETDSSVGENREYSVTYDENKDGRIVAGNTSTTVTNTKGVNTLPTGFDFSSAPFILMAAGAAVVLVLFMRKRPTED